MESGLNLLSSLPRRSLRTGAAARSPIDIDPDEAPLQADLFSVSQLERHARALAVGRDPTSSRERPADRLLPRLDANERALAAAYVMVTEAVQRGRRVTPAAEWFVDNFHLIEEQIRTARRHLPRVYSRELPRLRGAGRGVPRVYDLILELISHSHGRLDVDRPAGLRRRLSGGAAAPSRRAVGDPDHAAPGAAREPAPCGRQRDPRPSRARGRRHLGRADDRGRRERAGRGRPRPRRDGRGRPAAAASRSWPSWRAACSAWARASTSR
jgi:hypothetical protein